MRKGFANSTSSRWNVDTSEKMSSGSSKFSKVKFTFTLLTSPTPSRATRAHLPITARTKPSLTRCLFSSGSEILEQTARTSNLVILSIYLQKQLDRQWSEIFPATPMFFLSLFIGIFLFTVTPDYLCFPLPQSQTSLCDYYCPSWPLLPIINKIEYNCVLGHQEGTHKPKTFYNFRKFWLKINPWYPNCVCN